MKKLRQLLADREVRFVVVVWALLAAVIFGMHMTYPTGFVGFLSDEFSGEYQSWRPEIEMRGYEKYALVLDGVDKVYGEPTARERLLTIPPRPERKTKYVRVGLEDGKYILAYLIEYGGKTYPCTRETVVVENGRIKEQSVVAGTCQ